MIEKIGPVSNPLTIIAIFAGVAEMSGTLVLPFISDSVQSTYVWFLMVYPTLLLFLFFYVLYTKTVTLYAPSDFVNQKDYIELMETTRKVQKQVVENSNKIDETKESVDKLFLATMSGPMYNNLKKLDNPPFGNYKMDNGLKRELYYLRDVGYISITSQSEGSITKIPFEGNNLSIYVTVTDIGKDFIRLRKNIKK